METYEFYDKIAVLERQNQGLRRTVQHMLAEEERADAAAREQTKMILNQAEQIRTLQFEAEALENTGVFLIELIEAQGLVIEKQDAEIARLNALVEALNDAEREANDIIDTDYKELEQLRSDLKHARQADAEAAAVVKTLMDENAELRETVAASFWSWS